MTDETPGVAPDPRPSVAIVAMGPSNQAWFKRLYNNDNPGYFAHEMKLKFAELLKQRVQVNAREGGAGPIPLLDQKLAEAVALITPPEENYAKLSAMCDDMGKIICEEEIGPPFDEVWGINHMGKVLKDVDKLFVMDDLKVQQHRYAEMLDRDVPIITSKAYPEFPTSVSYPLDDVLADIGWLYFTNTVVYAVAYAIHKKFKRIGLFGCDFHYPGVDQSEQARANCEFLLGIAHQRGIKVEVAKGSTTMDQNKITVMYGYAEQPIIHRPDGLIMEFDYKKKGWSVRPNEGIAEPDRGAETPPDVPASDGTDESGTVLMAGGVPQCGPGEPGTVPDSG